MRSRRWYQIPTIPTSLGCPYDCNFCAAYLQGKYLLRDITSVRNEVVHALGRVVLFWDAMSRAPPELPRLALDGDATPRCGRRSAIPRPRWPLCGNPRKSAPWPVGARRWVVVGVETFGERLREHGGAYVDP